MIRKAILAAAIIAVDLALVSCGRGPDTTTSTTTADASQTSTTGGIDHDSSAAAPPKSKWDYSEDKDEMRGTTTHYATLTSENDLNLEFPYGSHPAQLYLRRGRSGLNVFIEIQGQFLCNDFHDSHVSVKFGSGAIQRFGCSEPDSGKPGILFIESERKFVNQLKRVTKVTIEVPVYQAGHQQLKFDVAGLVWK